MRFTGIATVALDEVTLQVGRGAERRCAECTQPFGDGDACMVFAPTKWDGGELGIEDVYLVHIKRNDGGTCLDDFVARFINGVSTQQEEDASRRREAPPAPLQPDPAPAALEAPGQPGQAAGDAIVGQPDPPSLIPTVP